MNLIEEVCHRMEFFELVLVVGLRLGIYVLGYCFFWDIFGMELAQFFFAGIDPDIDDQLEFGSFQKLGDLSSRRESI